MRATLASRHPGIVLVGGALVLAAFVAQALGDTDLAFGTLELNPTFDSLYVRSGETVVVALDVSDLEQDVKACQAFLGYNSYYLAAVGVVPGGGDWDDLIYQEISIPGEIDTAVGVLGESTTGTSADGTVAFITLLARPVEGTTRLVFRPDVSDVESTFLASMDARIVWPEKVHSPLIVIDNTPPTVEVSSASQGGQELIGTGVNAVQDTVAIAVEATDALAGLFGHPDVTVTPNGGLPESATFVSEVPEGTFNYAWTVTSTTPNGPAVIEAQAVDKAGNAAVAVPQTIDVNKNRITGLIELEAFVGTSRDVTFVALGGDRREWTIPVSGFAAHVASYVLDDVPDGTTSLSAKTAWNLRRRVTTALDAQGQGGADFVGGQKLLGGDFSGDNLINVVDYTVMRLNWLSTSPVADINGDGIVNVTDYVIMKINWFVAGDPE